MRPTIPMLLVAACAMAQDQPAREELGTVMVNNSGVVRKPASFVEANGLARMSDLPLKGEINVLDFGASTNIADNGPAFTAAFQAVPRASTWKYGAIGGHVKIPAGTYRFETSAVIPQDIGLWAHLVVDGYGARLTTTNAIVILDRWPTNRAETEFTAEAKIFIRGLQFSGSGAGTNGTGLRLSATYGGAVEDCDFWGLSAGLDAYWTIALEVNHVHSTYAPMRIQGGTNDVTGKGFPGSEVPCQSNHAKVRNCRFRSWDGQPYNLMLMDSSNLRVENCIFEGANPTNNIYVRVNEPITFLNMHVENAAKEAFFRFENLSRLVTVTIDGFEPNQCNWPGAISTLAMVVTNCDNPIFNLYNWQAVDCYPLFDARTRRLSNGTTGQPGQSGWFWNFASSGGQQDCNWTDPKYWVGGIVPTNMTILGERAGFSYYNQLRVRGMTNLGDSLVNGTTRSVGTISAEQVNGNIRLKSDGTTSKDGAIWTSADGTLNIANWSGTRGVRINPDGTMVTYGGALTVSNSVTATGGFFGDVSSPSGGIGRYGNLLWKSEEIAGATWGGPYFGNWNIANITANSVSDPRGTTNAATVTFQASGQCGVGQTVSNSATVPISGTNLVFSVWLKAPTNCVVMLYVFDDVGAQWLGSYTTVTTNWVRYTYAFTSRTTTRVAPAVVFHTAGGRLSDTFYMFGPQLEWGATPSQYTTTPTTSPVLPGAGLAGDGRALVNLNPANLLPISSNSWVTAVTLTAGQNRYVSSNGVPHVIWADQSATLHTNRLVP